MALACGHNTKSHTNEDRVLNHFFPVLTHLQGSCSALVSHGHSRRQNPSSLIAVYRSHMQATDAESRKLPAVPRGCMEQHGLPSSAPTGCIPCVNQSLHL